MISVIDTHAHLAMLEHAPLSDILDRATAAGIAKMVTVSVDEASWKSNEAIAAKIPNVYFSLGLHPHEALHWKKLKPQFIPFFENSAVKEKCVALGEMGLDFYYNKSPKEDQLEAFHDQIEIAKQLKLPIIIHCRDSFDELYGILRKVGTPERGGVMHCFTGNTSQAKEAIDLGLMISFSGIVTFKNAKLLQEAAKAIPENRIVIETDCPFLAPVPHRGSPNEPSYILETLKCIADLRGVPATKLAPIVFENSLRLFQI